MQKVNVPLDFLVPLAPLIITTRKFELTLNIL